MEAPRTSSRGESPLLQGKTTAAILIYNIFSYLVIGLTLFVLNRILQYARRIALNIISRCMFAGGGAAGN